MNTNDLKAAKAVAEVVWTNRRDLVKDIGRALLEPSVEVRERVRSDTRSSILMPGIAVGLLLKTIETVYPRLCEQGPGVFRFKQALSPGSSAVLRELWGMGKALGAARFPKKDTDPSTDLFKQKTVKIAKPLKKETKR